ncbi:MAG: SGNH/GDSL hydrolase family protein [Myxococcota bacterium]
MDLLADDKGRRRERWAVALLLMVSVLTALGLAEAVVRLLPSTALGFEYSAGRFTKPAEFEYPNDYNSRGFHDVVHGPKQAGVQRVLLLGDSYVEAYTVPLLQTVGRRLEHHLDSSEPGRFEVVAIGRSTWGQAHQLEMLRRLGPELRPDVVVTLFLSANDIRDNSPELQEAFEAQRARVRFPWRGWPRFSGDDAPLFVLRRSRLNQLLSHRLALAGSGRDTGTIPIDYLVYATPPDESWRRAWARTATLVRKTHELSRELGARYALVAASTPHGVLGAEDGLRALIEAYPAMQHGEWDLDAPNRLIARLCRGEGIPFLDLERRFRDETRGSGRRLHWKYDGHWNAAGNDLAAQSMAPLVIELLHASSKVSEVDLRGPDAPVQAVAGAE